jgi:hypothetical protein
MNSSFAPFVPFRRNSEMMSGRAATTCGETSRPSRAGAVGFFFLPPDAPPCAEADGIVTNRHSSTAATRPHSRDMLFMNASPSRNTGFVSDVLTTGVRRVLRGLG